MRNGFTLIEVIIAIAVLGSMVTAVLSLLASLQQTTLRTSRMLETAFFARDILAEATNEKFFNRQDPVEKMHRDGDIKAVYSIAKPSESSVLKKTRQLKIERIKISPVEGDRSTQFLSLRFVPDPPEKKEQKQT